MYITSESLKEFVENNSNLVQKKKVADNMYVLKYKRKVFYENLWNEFLEECRGTLIDSNYNVISMPFKKIYNYGIESKAPTFEDHELVIAMRKINGFMAAITSHKGELLISTTGSIDSPFVDYIKGFVSEELEEYIIKNPAYTYLFECVHPEDPHIIPEKDGLYYLGKRCKKLGGLFMQPNPLFNFIPGSIIEFPEAMSFRQVKDLANICKHEGYVIYSLDGRSTKIKSPYYLTKKFLARNPNTEKIMKANAKTFVDEEYYPLVDYIRSNIEEFTALDEQARLEYIRNYLEAR